MSELFDGEVPVVLSASRLIQPVASSPASVTIIDAQTIQASGARNIADVLRLVPGFQVGRLVNGNPVVAYHGLSERYNPRLQLIVDGRPTYVPLYGGIPWSELPIALTDIERIEVTRAPNAATFGPNSFSAVVSIITRAPAARSGWFLDSVAGGNRSTGNTLSYHDASQKLHYRATFQIASDEGFENIPDRERSKLASLRTDWQINANESLVIDIGAVQGGHTELDSVVEEADLVSYRDTTNAYAQLTWERAQTTEDAFMIRYYHNFFDMKDETSETFDLAEVTGNPDFTGLDIRADINRSSQSTRHELEMQRTQRLSERHRFVYGAALRQDSVKGQFIFNSKRKRLVTTQRLFAHSEFTATDRWLINSGLLVENNSLSNVTASPRLSLTHHASPGNEFRMSYSRGIRTPLLLEEEGNLSLSYTVSNGDVLNDLIVIDRADIKPETIDVFDLGFHHSSPFGKNDFDAKLSHHRMRDGIATEVLEDISEDTFDTSARAFGNRLNYRFNTLDLQYTSTFGNDSLFRASYAFTFGEDRLLQRRKLIPRHTLSLFGSVALTNKLTFSAEYYYTSTWIWDDVRDRSRLNRLDLRLQRDLGFSRLDASAVLQAELDLGGTTDYLERNQIDNLFFAGITLRLH
ncbi:MAG: TonB-dependent receptor plug domain-containing protein [Granulosicoccus sp.]